jgi:hypothetical protein
MHLITSPAVSKPAPARVNRTARETGDRIVAMLACPDCQGDGCPSCTDDAPAFADQIVEAVRTAAREAALYDAWNDGYYHGAERVPGEPPADYTEAEAREWHRGFDDGCDYADREEIEAAERMYAAMAEEALEREGVYFAY